MSDMQQEPAGGVRTNMPGRGDAAQTRVGDAVAGAQTESARESADLPVTRWSASRQDGQPGRVKVSDRLSRLMAETRHPDGQLWTISNLTEELTNRGHEVSRQYLSNLVQGHRENPPLRLLEALADVFSVPVAYFSDDYLGRVTNDLLPLLVALQDPTVRGLLTRPDLPEIAEVLADADRITATPEVRQLMARQDLPAVAGSVLDTAFLVWVGTRPLDQVLATLRAPVVQSAIEETLANWLKYGTGPR